MNCWTTCFPSLPFEVVPAGAVLNQCGPRHWLCWGITAVVAWALKALERRKLRRLISGTSIAIILGHVFLYVFVMSRLRRKWGRPRQSFYLRGAKGSWIGILLVLKIKRGTNVTLLYYMRTTVRTSTCFMHDWLTSTREVQPKGRKGLKTECKWSSEEGVLRIQDPQNPFCMWHATNKHDNDDRKEEEHFGTSPD